MKTSELRKKYPEFFAEIEAAVWDDCKINKLDFKIVNRISYNAAAVASFELHKILMQNKKAEKKYDHDYAEKLRGVIMPWLIAHGSSASMASIKWLSKKIQKINTENKYLKK
jgi:hypothetical protein